MISVFGGSLHPQGGKFAVSKDQEKGDLRIIATGENPLYVNACIIVNLMKMLCWQEKE